MSQPPRVFISYSHDSPEHKERVLQLSERLRADGIDAFIDQYIETTGPPEGWPRWMDEQLRTADFVLLVCTETYRKRVEGREEPGRGHGVLWEGTLVYQYIYDSGSRNDRFVPILLEGATQQDVPMPLHGVPNYRPAQDDGYEGLYRRLTGQARVEKGQLGSLRPLPSRKVELAPLQPSTQEEAGTPAPDPPTPPQRKPVLAVALVLVLALVSVGGWWFMRVPGVYRVRITVVDAQGNPVDQAQVTSSVGGEVLKSGQGWELQVPASSKPGDGTLVVRATVPEAFLRGETDVRLAGDSTVAAAITLKPDTTATVHGIVVDSSQRALAGVRVSVSGQPESVVTKDDGTFSLPAHAAEGQQVQLRAEKPGAAPATLYHPAGKASATIVLD